MKKLFLSGLLALLGTGAFAQTSAGTISLGGSLGLYSGSMDENTSERKTSSYSISPYVGYFIKDGLEIGINTRLSFNSSTTETEGSGQEFKTKSFGYGIGPHITKYISVTDKLYFTANGGFGLSGLRTKNPELDEELISTTSGYYIAASPGLTYFATTKLGFSASIGNIGYVSFTSTDKQAQPERETNSSNFDFNFSPATATLGIRYFITR
ncbi:outer membrane beta-barrel protein [Pontibacter cellulosilyticus]|uniref:Outer membrane beta-barrel protein n=1 Tax=Pontibacter cellulosilyticus TaxID=1720253 RepID=A0A923SI80_9BACT|nr:outer membrane beta-barrel protein [Pontibacter cellulosilyticus]MBC5992332.1 outer membrane beta-barrel protein [Pontibacter cellulosilyticus]